MNISGANDLRVAVTGASGYLGTNLCRYFSARHAHVLQLTSHPQTADRSMPAAQFTFDAGVSDGVFASHKISTLIHAAYDFAPRTRATVWEGNIKGSLKLFAQARAEGVEQIIFISSMSAYNGCRSLYGEAKLEIENSLRAMAVRNYSIRPGLIFSTPIEEAGGMVGSILQSLKGGLVPLIGNGQQQLYLSHVSDLSGLIESLLHGSQLNSGAQLTAANPRAYALREIVELLARSQAGRRPTFVPVPWRLAWAGVRTLETAGIRTKFRSDSILSLVHQNPNPDFSNLPAGIVFRDFAAELGAPGD